MNGPELQRQESKNPLEAELREVDSILDTIDDDVDSYVAKFFSEQNQAPIVGLDSLNHIVSEVIRATDSFAQFAEKAAGFGQSLQDVSPKVVEFRYKLKESLQKLSGARIILGESEYLGEVEYETVDFESLHIYRVFELILDYHTIDSIGKNPNIKYELSRLLQRSEAIAVFPTLAEKVKKLESNQESISYTLSPSDVESLQQILRSGDYGTKSNLVVSANVLEVIYQDLTDIDTIENGDLLKSPKIKLLQTLKSSLSDYVDISTPKIPSFSIERARVVLKVVDSLLQMTENYQLGIKSSNEFMIWKKLLLKAKKIRLENGRSVNFDTFLDDVSKKKEVSPHDYEQLMNAKSDLDAMLRNISAIKFEDLSPSENMGLARAKAIFIHNLKVKISQILEKHEATIPVDERRERLMKGGVKELHTLLDTGELDMGSYIHLITVGQYESDPKRNSVELALKLFTEDIAKKIELQDPSSPENLARAKEFQNFVSAVYGMYDFGLYQAVQTGKKEAGRSVRTDFLTADFETVSVKFTEDATRHYDTALRQNDIYVNIIDKVKNLAFGLMLDPKEQYAANADQWTRGEQLIRKCFLLLSSQDSEFKLFIDSFGEVWNTYGLNELLIRACMLETAFCDTRTKAAIQHLGYNMQSMKQKGGIPPTVVGLVEEMAYKMKSDSADYASLATGPIIVPEEMITGDLQIMPEQLITVKIKNEEEVFKVVQNDPNDIKKGCSVVSVSNTQKVLSAGEYGKLKIHPDGRVIFNKSGIFGKGAPETQSVGHRISRLSSAIEVIVDWRFGDAIGEKASREKKVREKLRRYKPEFPDSGFPSWTDLTDSPTILNHDSGKEEREAGNNADNFVQGMDATKQMIEQAKKAMFADYAKKPGENVHQYCERMFKTHINPLTSLLGASISYKWGLPYRNVEDELVAGVPQQDETGKLFIVDGDGNKSYVSVDQDDIVEKNGAQYYCKVDENGNKIKQFAHSEKSRRKTREQYELYRSLIEWQILCLFYNIIPENIDLKGPLDKAKTDYEDIYLNMLDIILIRVTGNPSLKDVKDSDKRRDGSFDFVDAPGPIKELFLEILFDFDNPGNADTLRYKSSQPLKFKSVNRAIANALVEELVEEEVTYPPRDIAGDDASTVSPWYRSEGMGRTRKKSALSKARKTQKRMSKEENLKTPKISEVITGIESGEKTNTLAK